MHLKRSFVITGIVAVGSLILGAVVGSALRPGVVAFSGDYCADGRAVSRLEQLVSFEGSFGSPSAGAKSVEEIRELAQGVVNLTLRGNETVEERGSSGSKEWVGITSTELLAGFRGISLGGGYVLTVAHGVINPSEYDFFRRIIHISFPHNGIMEPSKVGIDPLAKPHETGEGVAYSFDSHRGEWVPKTFQYQIVTQTQNVSTITALPRMDAALLYVAPSSGVQGTSNELRFRSAGTLQRGEKVYALVVRQDYGQPPERGPLLYPSLADVTVLEGIVVDPSPKGLSIPGQFLTSLAVIQGDSGSPVFDSSSNLIGILTGDVQIGTNEYSAITSIDSLLPLIRAEQQQLACTK